MSQAFVVLAVLGFNARSFGFGEFFQAAAQTLRALVYLKQGNTSAAHQEFQAAQQCMQNYRHSRYTWWDEYLFNLCLWKEAAKVIETESGLK